MSDLLNQASLVMVPSGYKEDTVYSVVPSDGSGDLSFTRASNGTRVNSAGLVEVCPWNLLLNTDTFSSWNLEGGTLTSGFTAPDGSSTAYKYVQIPGGGLYSGNYGVTADVKFAQVWIKSVSGGSLTCNISDGAAFFGTFNVTGEWQLFTAPFTANTRIGLYLYGISNAQGIYVWHPQVNIGSTAKPYFPTTDRLNVPRLTYQNGGGGCPSLLLEKQSTNLCLWSNAMATSPWTTYNGTSTDNDAISPDGTQNATKVVMGAGDSATIRQTISGLTNGQPYTFTLYIKQGSGVTAFLDISDTASTVNITPTNEWVRYTYTANWNTSLNFVDIELRGTSGSAFCYIWGAQLEAGSYATSMIYTTSSSATRVADACYKTGISSLIGQTEGTLYFELQRDNTDNDTRLQISDGTTNNWLFVSIETGLNPRAYCNVGGVNQFSAYGSAVSNLTHKVALAYKNNDFKVYIDGVAVITQTSGSVPACNRIDVGSGNPNGPVVSTSLIKEVVLFPTRLTNAELAQLTA